MKNCCSRFDFNEDVYKRQVLHDSDLTGIQFPVKRGADGGEGTGFRGKDYGIAPMSLSLIHI